MKKGFVVKIFLSVVSLCVFAAVPVFAAEMEIKPPVGLKQLELTRGLDKTRIDAVGRALDFGNWPRVKNLYVAPEVTRSLISRPERVTGESASYGYVRFGEDLWGKYDLSWRSVAETKEPVPRELPPDLKDKLLNKLSDEQRKDEEFVSEYLKLSLDRYVKTRKHRLDGELMIEVCLTPGSRSANEYMLARMTENMMSTEGLIDMYKSAKRPARLGNISFLAVSRTKKDVRINLVRGNIYLGIRANGVFASDALPLAQKIDAMILKQPPLTSRQLTGRRPLVSISPEAKDDNTVDFDIATKTTGQKAVSVSAFIDGENATIKDGSVLLADRKGKARVKIIAVTRELLVISSERELIVNE